MTIHLSDGDFSVACDTCGTFARVPFSIQPDAVLACVREMIAHGWHIGGEVDQDACPGCANELPHNEET